MFELHKQGAVKVIVGHQPLNLESAPTAIRLCDEALSQGQPRLVFDMQGVPLIDSAGLELLLDVRDRCAQRGGAMHLAGPTALCRDILSATRVAGDFAIFDDVLSAVGSFAQ
jgi:anti-anti-sigma factor